MSEEYQELKLLRHGKQLNQGDFIKSSDSMNRMQSIIEKLIGNSADIQKFIPTDNNFKSTKSKYKISIQDIKDNLNDKRKDIFKLLKNEITPSDTAQYLKDIEEKMKEIQAENQILQKDLEYKKDIFVKKELEYRKIIQNLQEESRSKALLNLNDGSELQNVAQTHQSILKVIGDIQKQTSKILIDQESDILRFFNNKINEIKKQFEEERIKKKNKDQDYVEKENQLIHELDWIKNIAQKIDNENHNLQKKYVDLNSQYKTQEKDKNGLIKDLLMLKKQNQILQKQINNFESILNEVSRDDINNESINDSQIYQKNFEQQNQDTYSQKNNTIKLPQIVNNNNNFNNTVQTKNMNSQSRNQFYNNTGGLNHKSQQSTGNLMRGSNYTQTQIQRTELEIQNVQEQLKREQKHVRELKILYMNQLSNKQNLEQILRKCVDDIKEEIIRLKGGKHAINSKKPNNKQTAQQQAKIDKQVEKLLNDEKTLTLIYDKTFYSDTKKIDNIVIENASMANETNNGNKDTAQIINNELEFSKISKKDEE